MPLFVIHINQFFIVCRRHIKSRNTGMLQWSWCPHCKKIMHLANSTCQMGWCKHIPHTPPSNAVCLTETLDSNGALVHVTHRSNTGMLRPVIDDMFIYLVRYHSNIIIGCKVGYDRNLFFPKHLPCGVVGRVQNQCLCPVIERRSQHISIKGKIVSFQRHEPGHCTGN
ncbi:MAG: hypothetical protein C5S43_00700 [Candidatus Methanocomedens sp.]|nr:MAG: hypothetical protein C5S43_00700 [ANME-2 cluster archaeon]